MSETTSPVNIIMIGMAGSGKTTLMQRINAYLHEKKTPPYVLNLDPAVSKLPFQANIDIRDTVDYKQVMSEYNLGPNGGILTSLNLFTTKLDQTQLPFLVAFNKIDVVSHEFAVNWMEDFEAFQQALMRQEEGFMNSLMNSMSLVLDEFYNHLRVVGVSAMTGQGMDEFFVKIDEAVKEYHEEFRPNMEKQMEKKREQEKKDKEQQLRRLMHDLSVTDGKEVDLNKKE
ncbi:hypothetical protein FB645_000038 [Coemansia sp. IMI 203386]|nr:hypothetical protein FB645_000038 [Coemansia sp. IMI 203386]